jgi:hypothetical protein
MEPPIFCLLSGVWRLLLLHMCRESSTNRPYFMQNKPNFRKSQMNVNNTITKDYGNWTLGQRGKNKPNSKPIQTQSKPISETPKMNVTSFFTKDYRNELARAAGTNKPKQTQFQGKLVHISRFGACINRETLCNNFFYWPGKAGIDGMNGMGAK